MAFLVLVFTVLFAAILYFVCSRRRKPSSKTDAPWKRSGWLKSVGIPAPRGRHEVGCVDLMHRLEGDSDGLLVRLFYPTDPGLAGQYPYAKAIPLPRYLMAGISDVFKVIPIPSCLRSILSYPVDFLFGQ